MFRKACALALMVAFAGALVVNNTFAATTTTAGTKPFFEPIVEIVLDKTGSMLYGPLGDSYRYGADDTCTANTTKCGAYGFSSSSSITSCSTDCSRIAIAQRVLFKVLDYNGDESLTDDDKTSWKLKIGAMIYYWQYKNKSSATTNNYSYQVGGITDSYQQIMCGSGTKSCTQTKIDLSTASSPDAGCYNTSSKDYNMCLADKTTGGGTNTTQALAAAKTYLDGYNTGDDACRKKYVILITDGSDNKAYYNNVSACVSSGTGYDCGNSGGTNGKDTILQRREVVLQAKALADAGYKVFVMGFASGLESFQTNTLNWMALWGDPINTESDYPLAAIKPSGIKSVRTSACVYTDLASGLLPVSSCTSFTNVPNFFAPTNDPGYADFSVFKAAYSTLDLAYFSNDTTKLAQDLRGILGAIFSENYSFSQASIQAVRDDDESYLYEASYESAASDPFWIGHLKRYKIDTTTGAIASTADWDAGEVLQSASASGRNIYTYKSGSGEVAFNTTNINYTDLGLSSATEAADLISFIRGGELVSGYAYVGWKLGDISRSSPLSIGTPNILFYDKWDSAASSTDKAFYKYRSNHIRSSASGTRLIFLGANDGQLHLFKTGEVASGGGAEVWSFIPPNYLPTLKKIAHKVHPAAALTSGVTLSHTLFVDGPTSGAEVWLGSGALCTSTSCGIAKNESDWHTYAIMSLGLGGADTLWSSSLACDSGFNASYSATYKNYCGYYAFDTSDTASISTGGARPQLKWRVGWKVGETTSSLGALNGPYLGQPYSKMIIGRVRENNEEKWVGLIGGGYSGEQYKSPGYNVKGKGFFVINMKDGSLLWYKTHSDLSTMEYDLAAPIAGIDTDNDGFMDVAYAPDTGGNVWRFKFCSSASDANPSSPCTALSNWSASKLFDSSAGTIRPIYTSVAAAKDPSGNIWVYFGTGDKINPNDSSAQEYFFGIKDDLSKTVSGFNSLSLLSNDKSDYYTYTSSKPDGWYMAFTGSSQKILSDPVVFEGVVYFTVFTPRKTGDACDEAGESYVYGVDYMTGAGALTDSSGNTVKGKYLGEGLASGLTASRGKDGWNLYAFTSVGSPHAQDVSGVNKSNASSNSVIYWKDRRVK